MRRIFEIGGFVAGIMLVGFGIAVIALALSGRSTVQESLEQEQIVGSPDMTPALILEEIQDAGLDVDAPDCTVAGELVDSGDEARCFAEYMRIHALIATGGQTYAQMPRFITESGEGTNDPDAAATGPTGRPMDNPARNIWITETALATALNMSYMATQLSLFSLVVGVALLLTGIGFLVLTALGALRRPRGEANAP